MIIKTTLLYGVNSIKEEYLIRIPDGAKCTIHGKHVCPDEVTEGDVQRALKDGVDISRFKGKNECISNEELLNFRDWVKSYIGSREFKEKVKA